MTPPPRSAVDHCGVRIRADLVGRWTAERIAVTRRDYPTLRATREIYAECCALPGDAMPSFEAWQTFACIKLGLARVEVLRSVQVTSPLADSWAKLNQGEAAQRAPDLGPRDRLARALTLPPDPAAVTDEPILADAATIRATAELWGVMFRGEVDLWAVNQAATRRGARRFLLVEDAPTEKKSRRCLRCQRKLTTDRLADQGDSLCLSCRSPRYPR